MASVKLKKRLNLDGTTSLFLDIYSYSKDAVGQKKYKRKYQFLDECKLLKPTDSIIRAENKTKLNLAEQIRNNKEKELLTRKHDIVIQNNQIYFKDFYSDYLKNYTKKNRKNVKSTLDHFENYLAINKIDMNLYCSELKMGHIESYLHYLQENFKGETPETYFRLFKRIVISAYKKGFIRTNIAEDVVCKKGEPEIKDILDFEEIQVLADTPCTNPEIRKAFLFSCYTGLRWVDVKALTWECIQGNELKIIQAKTKHPVEAEINEVALKLLGERKHKLDKVFELPSHSYACRTLKTWCTQAQIFKNITWHCARHSFGTNIIEFGAGVNTASDLLGHKTWEYTKRYVHKSKKLEKQAINSLPKIEI